MRTTNQGRATRQDARARRTPTKRYNNMVAPCATDWRERARELAVDVRNIAVAVLIIYGWMIPVGLLEAM